MRGSLYLAWQYIRHHRGTTAVLVCSVTLIAFLPAALEVIVGDAAEHFRSRAASTPLVVGLSMAPAMVVAQRAAFVDLDGPLLLARDREPPITYEGSKMHLPPKALWG